MTAFVETAWAWLKTWAEGLEPTAVALQVLDVAIAYYVIYRVLLLVKGTRAAQMLLGLVVLSAGVAASRLLNLRTIGFLIEALFGSIIIVLVVLFQHDIRRALQRMGRTTFLGPLTRREAPIFFEELVQATTQMSQQRMGALIVIERGADLTDYTEGGISIDAKVSRDLLISLFNPASPIHDGAVIIQEGRVKAAGCFLPLTANQDVARTLGTRHRAAIGITEETDAAVIVVSEQSGTISMALDGRITRDLDGHVLRTVLEGLLTRHPGRRGWPSGTRARAA